MTRCAHCTAHTGSLDFLIDFSPKLFNLWASFCSISPVQSGFFCSQIQITSYLVFSCFTSNFYLITVIWNHGRPWDWVSRLWQPVQTTRHSAIHWDCHVKPEHSTVHKHTYSVHVQQPALHSFCNIHSVQVSTFTHISRHNISSRKLEYSKVFS